MSHTDNQPPLEAARPLADDHLEVDLLLHALLAALEQENQPQSFELLDLLWARLAVHIRAEHLCLFPSILDEPPINFTGSDGTPQYDEAKRVIDSLRDDHEFFMSELGTAVNSLRKDPSQSDQDVISERLQDVRRSVVKVQSRLITHNQLEENHVYKWVNVLLGEARRLTLMARIRHEIENIPPRFNV